MKTCTRCKIEKPLDAFYKHSKAKKDGHQSHCKVCDNHRKNVWKAKNPQLSKTYAKKADSNKYLKNKEHINTRNKAWKKSNPGKLQAMDAKRRAAKKYRTPNWLTEQDLEHIRCKYEVAAMLNKYGVHKWHVDHIIPLQGKLVSGLHVPYNLQVVPEAVNLQKGNKYLGVRNGI